MTRWLREFRLLPVVLIAIGCLFALKTMGLVLDGGYTLGQRLGGSSTLVVTTVPVAPTMQMRSPSTPLEMPSQPSSGPKLSWMQEMFNYPDITGSVPAPKPADKAAPKKEPPPQTPESKAASGTPIAMDQPRGASAGERALLERLQERRQELDARARELDLRESLIKAAEKKLETANATSGGEVKAAGSPAQRQDDADKARLKGVITMYETMKPKDAAKIFDRLDPKVLLDMASQIKPQRMSEILALMSPEAAERLTVELATRGAGDRTVNPASLPKIDGRPGG